MYETPFDLGDLTWQTGLLFEAGSESLSEVRVHSLVGGPPAIDIFQFAIEVDLFAQQCRNGAFSE